MAVFIKRTGGVKNIKDLKAHIKYVGFRSRDRQEDKGFFNHESDNTDWKNFLKDIENNKALNHPKAIKAHKLVFSLKEHEYNAYKMSGKDYKDLIRKVIKEYEEKHNLKLDWIASIHESEGHPHCHVIVRGVSMKDKEGKFKRIYFNKEDFKELKDIFNKELGKEVQYRGFQRITGDKNVFNNILKDIGKGFDAISNSIQRDIQKKEFEYKIKNQKDINEKERINKKNDRERDR